MNKETYLGDGLYASFDGWSIWLRAPRQDGDHLVALEPDVLAALNRYAADLKAPPATDAEPSSPKTPDAGA